jgi:hypothetical protein
MAIGERRQERKLDVGGLGDEDRIGHGAPGVRKMGAGCGKALKLPPFSEPRSTDSHGRTFQMGKHQAQEGRL